MSKNEERYLLQALELEGSLRASLHRYAGKKCEVEDLLQETYARLLVAAAADAPEVHSIRQFALGIARAVAAEWLRQEHAQPIPVGAQLETLEADEPRESVEEIVKRRQDVARLVSAIQRLPERCRRVFTLRKVYGYSPAQIASRLGVPARLVLEDLQAAARRCAQIAFDPPALQPTEGWLARLRIRP